MRARRSVAAAAAVAASALLLPTAYASAFTAAPVLSRPSVSLSVRRRRALLFASTRSLERPVVVCPGFGNDSVDYGPLSAATTSPGLLASLARRTSAGVTVVPVQRIDWLQVFAKGLVSLSFWRGTLTPYAPPFNWYLEALEASVEAASAEAGGKRVVLVAHSAGGWLARAWLGTPGAADRVCGLVTLGSPQLPAAAPLPDMTRGALRYVAEAPTCAGTPLSDSVAYVTVASDAVTGNEAAERGSRELTAFTSYSMVCGDGAVSGDGITPLQSAHLEGALQLTLGGVLHSIDTPEEWYGAESGIDQWWDKACREVEKREPGAAGPSLPAGLLWFEGLLGGSE